MDSNCRHLAPALVEPERQEYRAVIAETLARFGSGALRLARQHGTRIVPLRSAERYRDVSAALRRLEIDVDRWDTPPAGLFVVEERTIYLRSRSPMTIAHEFGHALDCALGGGVYRSSFDTELRRCFESARRFVTPYAATGADEYFAEGLRAWVEVNDIASHWPRATKARLRRIDPRLFEYVDVLFRVDFSAAA